MYQLGRRAVLGAALPPGHLSRSNCRENPGRHPVPPSLAWIFTGRFLAPGPGAPGRHAGNGRNPLAARGVLSAGQAVFEILDPAEYQRTRVRGSRGG
jgi:hypothetical protein